MKWICSKCGFEIKTSREKHFNSCNGYGTRRNNKSPNLTKRGSKEYCDKMSNIIKEKYLTDSEFKNKISDAIKRAAEEGKYLGVGATEESERIRRNGISQTSKKNKKSGGLRHGSGRGIKGWYKGYWCDSSWELAYVIYNIEHSIKFERNKNKFDYLWEGEKHYYIPDFILEDGLYVEIKGYRTKQVDYKINQFPYKIEIIDKKKIKKYINYAENIYGKDFVKLYEEGHTDLATGTASNTVVLGL